MKVQKQLNIKKTVTVSISPPVRGDPKGGMPIQNISAGRLWVGTRGFPQCRCTRCCSSPLLKSVIHGLLSFPFSRDVQISGASETLTQVWWVHLCSAVLEAVYVVNNTWKDPCHLATSGASFHSLTRNKSPGWML